MRDWLLPLLQCVRCASPGLELAGRALDCRSCGASFPIEGNAGDGIVDCLDQPHPSVAKEIAAVASLDSHDSRKELLLRALLADLARGDAEPNDPRLTEFPSFREFFPANRRTREMLRNLHPKPGAIVVELGADHCLHSGALLDSGCRVVAVDITDHSRLAPRADVPKLCRIRADMNRLPLADATVDLVWATACVHHSWSLERTFNEAHRVLCEGGRFVLLSEPMPGWIRYLLSGFGSRFGREQRKLGINETLHQRSEWLATARNAGFLPRLYYPTLGDRELAERLEKRSLPGWLAPLLRRLGRHLQVSIHMVAEKLPA